MLYIKRHKTDHVFKWKMMRRLAGLSFALVGMLTPMACTQSLKPTSFNPIESVQDWKGIFSTRPSEESHAFFLIKLKTPPLLSISNSDSPTKIDSKLLQAVTSEQDNLIKNLLDLSTEIKVLYRYRMVINGVAVVAPTSLFSKISEFSGVAHLESAGQFSRPEMPQSNAKLLSPTTALASRNSVKFIGASEAHSRGLRGQGLKVGIIDSGIDFTHLMLGGDGQESTFKSIDVDKPTAFFPNQKIVGGVDFVGSKFDAGSADFWNRVPVMDANPMDEGGHGTHVAGTVAGLGDGLETYDGVAPGANLYALKVFGAAGSTNDTVVIAALEYAADPNGDGDLSDRLDVVNLSLGSGYGSSQILYGEAVRNITKAGVAVVAAAGNNGDVPYIVGSPGATDEALSVAAGIDDMDHNWSFRALKFQTVSEPEILVEAIEGAVTRPLAQSGTVQAPLVYGGLADQDFSPDLKTGMSGKIAFLDRGGVAFATKIKRAVEAGAIGVVVANNQQGDPIVMGGEGGPFPIPGVMITKDLGDRLKESMKSGDVLADLTTSRRIEKPQLIDTVTKFSSRGPRSIDGAIKPEIMAPGEEIVSARLGGGKAGRKMSGTSMASPHMAGVMALLKQKFPTLTPLELKAIAMGTAKTVLDKEGKYVPVSRQGAGRVQVMKALDAQVFASPAAISLGEIVVERVKTFSRKIELRSLSTTDAEYVLELREASPELQLDRVTTHKLQLKAGTEQVVDLRMTIKRSASADSVSEVSGLIVLKKPSTNDEVLRIPVLAVVNRIAGIQGKDLYVRSTSQADSQGAVVDLTLINSSENAGKVLPFNKIGQDARKADPHLDPFRSKICDLAESGYRIVEKNGSPTLQVAVKLHEPMTTWDLCEVSVLIDSNGDLEADQELAGLRKKYVEGLSGDDYASVLLDVKKARQIRLNYEAEMMKPRPPPSPGAPTGAAPKLNYSSALLATETMQAYENSTVSVLETPLSALALTSQGTLSVRIATSAQTGSAIEPDDFLANNPKRWRQINVRPQGPGFLDLPEAIALEAHEKKTVSFTKGAGHEALLILMPNGRPLWNATTRDGQSQTLSPLFKVD